ncbi:MAG: 6,7-dimethyl-8-ribityllumazine synthase [Paracoccaceae bacterium]
MTALKTNAALPDPKFDNPTRLLIVAMPNDDITGKLVAEARAAIISAGARCELLEVPGALEIPTAIRLANAAGRYDGYVALGCIIRQQHVHYKMIRNITCQGLMLLGVEGICIGNGIIALKNPKNAKSIGHDAALAAMHLIAIKRRFTNPGPGRIAPASEHILMAGNTGKPRGNT